MSKKDPKERVPSPGQITSSPFPGSAKVYVAGSREDLRVPVRQITLTNTGGNGDQAPSISVYDTSGPYTDPATNIDIHAGLPVIRQPWILEGGDTEEVTLSAYRYTTPRVGDAGLAAIRFPGVKRARRAKPGMSRRPGSTGRHEYPSGCAGCMARGASIQ